MRHLNHINLAIAITVQFPEPLIEMRFRYNPDAPIVTKVLIDKMFCLCVV